MLTRVLRANVPQKDLRKWVLRRVLGIVARQACWDWEIYGHIYGVKCDICTECHLTDAIRKCRDEY